MQLGKIELNNKIFVKVVHAGGEYTFPSTVASHNEPHNLITSIINRKDVELVKLLQNCDSITVAMVDKDNRYLLFENVKFELNPFNEVLLLTMESDETGVYAERRLFPRFVIDKDCAFAIGNSQIFTSAKVHDVSRYGLSIVTSQKIPVKSEIHVTLFDFVHRESITSYGTVVYKSDTLGTITYGVSLGSDESLVRFTNALQSRALVEK